MNVNVGFKALGYGGIPFGSGGMLDWGRGHVGAAAASWPSLSPALLKSRAQT